MGLIKFTHVSYNQLEMEQQQATSFPSIQMRKGKKHDLDDIWNLLLVICAKFNSEIESKNTFNFLATYS